MHTQFLVTYQLNELSQKDKMKLLRGLYGYSNKKANKIYFQKGVLEKLDAKRVGINVILVRQEDFGVIKNFFKQFKLSLEVMEVFVK